MNQVFFYIQHKLTFIIEMNLVLQCDLSGLHAVEPILMNQVGPVLLMYVKSV